MLIKPVNAVKNQSGVALVIALIMIIVLTVIVLAASLTSIFEIKLAGNKRGSTDAFFAADSGVQVATASVENFDSEKYKALDKYQYHYSQADANKNPTKNPSNADIVMYKDSMRTDCPRGYGFSATEQYYNCRHFLIESTGQDQIELNPVKSASTIQEKVVRLVPQE